MSCDGLNISTKMNTPSSDSFYHGYPRHESKKYELLGGNHTHPRATSVAMPPSSLHEYFSRHGSWKYVLLGSNHTHPRATNTIILLASLSHSYASGLATPCSTSSTIHPNEDDGSHSTKIWYTPIVEYHPPQTDEELCTP